MTEDPSQGGTAEGVAWLSRAAWRQYLLTGDETFLRRVETALRPWTEAWLARDADGRGLVVDVSEWMDHSRFFLFPDGARTLYSNVLFAEHLARFAGLERALGADSLARRYDRAFERFADGVNASLWNERFGQYDNLELWGRRDERVTSAENALAVLSGIASEERARRALARVREQNWREAGSTTIYPPMTHVPDYIDHNYKVWPWWEAVEARARFRIGDAAGALALLGHCSATLDDPHFPGMMEELTSPEGRTEGGFAFLTAAGSYLDAVVGGVLGVEVVAPGCARLRVAPGAPVSWANWRAIVPLPEGELRLEQRAGVLTITVTDPRVREVEAPANAVVVGARRVPLEPRPFPQASGRVPEREPIPAPRPRDAVVFGAGEGFPPSPALGLACRTVGEEDLLRLDPAREGALIVPGNALPRRTRTGGDVPAALGRYLDAGGALVFAGATMVERGTMGERSGVIEWYERRPVVTHAEFAGWTFRRSFDPALTPQAEERGMREGWQARKVPRDSVWAPIGAGKPWEQGLGYDYDGWGWYRASFRLPAGARGRVVVVDLGRVDDDDWTYVNGVLVGAQSDWQSIRHYRIAPGDSAYSTLVFGGDNTIAVQVRDSGGGGGLFVDTPWFGAETDQIAWSPVDPRSGEVAPAPVRHGVVSWGPGGRFFNSWETSRGAFGFELDGWGVTFTGPLTGMPALSSQVSEGFTDFAVSRPWRFEPLAFTRTARRLLVPDDGEDYPCAARLVNTATGGEIVLLGASLTHHGLAVDLLTRLRIETGRNRANEGRRK